MIVDQYGRSVCDQFRLLLPSLKPFSYPSSKLGILNAIVRYQYLLQTSARNASLVLRAAATVKNFSHFLHRKSLIHSAFSLFCRRPKIQKNLFIIFYLIVLYMFIGVRNSLTISFPLSRTITFSTRTITFSTLNYYIFDVNYYIFDVLLHFRRAITFSTSKPLPVLRMAIFDL